MEHLGTHPDPAASLTKAPVAAPVNYYRVLDVDVRATRMEIRESYLRLKATYNSGSAALYSLISEDEAKEQMALVEEAFRVLNDDVARHEFDKKLGLAQEQRAAALGDFAASPVPGIAGIDTSWSDDRPNEGMVHTQRQALPIIKLRAHRAGSDEMKRQMQELVDASDAGDGDLFRRLREICDVSHDEMQERTKISIGYLQAIESNRFERLPQAVYVKGFLRSYFRYLSAPEAEKMVTAFSARLHDWQVNKKS
jgi:hypothetical protein